VVASPDRTVWVRFEAERVPGRYSTLRRLNLSRVTAASDWQVETDPVGGLTPM
jgi:hypothetical protein